MQITSQSCAWPLLDGSSCAGSKPVSFASSPFLPVSVAHRAVSQSFQLALNGLTPNVLQPLAWCPPMVASNDPNGKGKTSSRQNRTWRCQDDGAPCEKDSTPLQPPPHAWVSRHRLQAVRHWVPWSSPRLGSRLTGPFHTVLALFIPDDSPSPSGDSPFA